MADFHIAYHWGGYSLEMGALQGKYFKILLPSIGLKLLSSKSIRTFLTNQPTNCSPFIICYILFFFEFSLFSS